MDIVIMIVCIISMIMTAILIILTLRNKGQSGGIQTMQLEAKIEQLQKQLKDLQRENSEAQSTLRQEINANVNSSIGTLGTQLKQSQSQSSDSQDKQIKTLTSTVNTSLSDIRQGISDQFKQFELRLTGLESKTEKRLIELRKTVEESLAGMREDNNKQLEKMRNTVDRKLQETLEQKMNDSFKLVSERLEQVYKGLGEMKSIAEGVGDLKNVLSNVKTRGILGEIQLSAILREILAPEQYEENIATVPKSTERVEFAVKLPGSEEGKPVYLPIDSKFNGDKYIHLQEAYESGSKERITAAKKELETAIKKNAKDIREKYIYPPSTTNFGIMFLPFEGLYAEVVNSGLVEVLQKEYNVNITGPSTMAAMLNSLQMGFRTLAIQKRSDEVWNTLSAVKTEFGKFEEALNNTQKKLQSVEKELDTLVGTRTRAINRKLKNVETIDSYESRRLIDSE